MSIASFNVTEIWNVSILYLCHQLSFPAFPNTLFYFFFISSIRPSRLHNLRASLLHCNLVFITQIPKPYSSVQYTRHLTILFSKVLFLFLDELTDIEEFAGIYINKENAIT